MYTNCIEIVKSLLLSSLSGLVLYSYSIDNLIFLGDKTVRVYHAKDFKELPYSPIKVFRYGVNSVIFDKQEKYLASACNDGNAYVFQLTESEAKVIVFIYVSCITR